MPALEAFASNDQCAFITARPSTFVASPQPQRILNF